MKEKEKACNHSHTKKEQLSISLFFSNCSMTLKMGHGHQTSMQMYLKISPG